MTNEDVCKNCPTPTDANCPNCPKYGIDYSNIRKNWNDWTVVDGKRGHGMSHEAMNVAEHQQKSNMIEALK